MRIIDKLELDEKIPGLVFYCYELLSLMHIFMSNENKQSKITLISLVFFCLHILSI
jgi:hypothetical protein